MELGRCHCRAVLQTCGTPAVSAWRDWPLDTMSKVPQAWCCAATEKPYRQCYTVSQDFLHCSLPEWFLLPCQVSIAQALGLCNMPEGIPSSFLRRPGCSSGKCRACLLAVTKFQLQKSSQFMQTVPGLRPAACNGYRETLKQRWEALNGLAAQ